MFGCLCSHVHWLLLFVCVRRICSSWLYETLPTIWSADHMWNSTTQRPLQFVWVKRTSICDQLHASPNTMKPSRCTQSSLWAFQRDQECRSEASQFGGSHLYKQNKTNKLPSFIDSYCLHLFATKPIMRNQTTHSSIFKVWLNYGHCCPTFDVVDCSFTPLAF
jgi:hypothetical protein